MPFTGDLVAIWEVPMSDGLHRIELEHGTTSGKRVVTVDGQEILHKEWMFKLVGSEAFEVGKAKCIIRIEPLAGFSYEYSLEVNGKSYKKFTENQSKIMKTWLLDLEGEMFRVVLEKDTLDIWMNGMKIDTAAEFVEDGTETHFCIKDKDACVKAVSSGNKREGLIHVLILGGVEIPETYD